MLDPLYLQPVGHRRDRLREGETMSRASEGPARSVALIAPLAVIAGLIAAVLCYHPEPARPVVALTVASG